MERRAIAQFKLEDGTEVFFAVPEPQDDTAIEEVAGRATRVYQVAEGAAGSFEQAIATMQPVVNAVIERLKKGLITPADEVEVKFGLSLSADLGAIFSSVGADVNFEITLKWQNPKP